MINRVEGKTNYIKWTEKFFLKYLTEDYIAMLAKYLSKALATSYGLDKD